MECEKVVVTPSDQIIRTCNEYRAMIKCFHYSSLIDKVLPNKAYKKNVYAGPCIPVAYHPQKALADKAIYFHSDLKLFSWSVVHPGT